MRVSRLPLILAVSGCFLVGCGRSWRALPRGGQISINKDRGILEKRSGVAVLVRPTSVPWDDDDKLTAFTAEVTNFREQAVRLSYRDFVLVTEEELEREALDPDALEEAFAQAVADAEEGVPAGLRNALASSVRVRRHCRRRYPRYYYRYDYYPYGYRWYHYYGWGPYWYDDYYAGGYDEQIAREHISQFLAELLRERSLAPKGAMSGHVLFSYDPAKEETLTLRVHVRPGGEPTPEAETPPAEPVTFRFRFEAP